MTAPIGTPAGAAARVIQDPAERDQQIRTAAQQFEALMLQQLVSVMRTTTPGMFEGAGGEQYAAMFDEQFGQALSGQGGVGIAEQLARSMGASPREQPRPAMSLDAIAAGVTPGHAPPSLGPVMEDRPVSGADLHGATGALQDAAREMLPENGVAPQWGRDGALTTEDLASEFHTEGPGGAAYFGVRDARGFQGYYKCNLFALELSRRAGFQVPLAGRRHGWGYVGPTFLAEDAADGRLRGEWATVATGASAAELDSAIVRGDRAFVLTGSGDGEHRGHMAVIERVHDVEYDEAGQITRIRFDGWEGRSRGAMHLTDRVWSVTGTRGGPGSRGGLGRIEIIELQRPDEGESAEQPLHQGAPASIDDGPR